MNESHPIGSYVRRYLLEYVIIDRCLSRNTQKSYRDAIRLLLKFLSQFYSCDATQLTVEQVTADAVRSFLTQRQKQNGNSAATRNQRLATIHSFIRFAARQTPELLDLATQVQNIPLWRVAPKQMPYLEKEEIDTLLATPDRQRSLGRRDYAILLFLYNTGARAQEVADALVRNLSLDSSSPWVRIRGKGNKTRICPLWPHTVKTLRTMLGERIEGPPEAPVFLNVRGEPITRYGIHTLVERTVARAAQVLPSLRTKRVSPHTIRQYVECRNMGSDNHFLMYCRELSLNRSPYYLVQHNLFNHSIKSSSSSHFGKLLGKRSEYADSKAMRFFSVSALAYTSVVLT